MFATEPIHSDWLADPFERRSLAGSCDPPLELTQANVTNYAARCGTSAATSWLAAKTGLDLSDCSTGSASDLFDCATRTATKAAGVPHNPLNADGSVNWDNVVRDAGAITGTVLCATGGATAVAIPICAWIGDNVFGAVYEWASDYFSVSHPIDCTKWSAFTPTVMSPEGKSGVLQYMTQDYVKQTYITRLATLHSLATATAALIEGFARRAGVPPAKANVIIAPVAPKGWSSLLRIYQELNYKIDLVSIGALAAQWWTEFVFQDRSIPYIYPTIPAYLTNKFWVDNYDIDSGATDPATFFFREFVITPKCGGNGVFWLPVGNTSTTLTARVVAVAQEAAHPTYNKYTYYYAPKTIDDLLVGDQATFDFVTKAWGASINRNLTKELDVIKLLPVSGLFPSTSTSTSNSSIVPLVIGAALVGGIAWWFTR